MSRESESQFRSTDPDGERPAAPTEAAGAFLARLRILVVDDDASCLDSVHSLLALDGHEIVTASGGREALDWARRLRRGRERLDLSILDFHMPDFTGIETYRLLTAEMPGVQAIFISGDVSHGLEEAIRSAGGRALVKKPLDVSLFRRVVREVAGSMGFVLGSEGARRAGGSN